MWDLCPGGLVQGAASAHQLFWVGVGGVGVGLEGFGPSERPWGLGPSWVWGISRPGSQLEPPPLLSTPYQLFLGPAQGRQLGFPRQSTQGQ